MNFQQSIISKFRWAIFTISDAFGDGALFNMFIILERKEKFFAANFAFILVRIVNFIVQVEVAGRSRGKLAHMTCVLCIFFGMLTANVLVQFIVGFKTIGACVAIEEVLVACVDVHMGSQFWRRR